jgi:prenyl protein peptidase
MALARTIFQFTYTSLFGFFAAFVYIRTGNLLSVILAHSFCNWMGLPRLSGRVGVEAGVSIGSPGARKRDDDDDDYPRYESRGVTWTVAYYALLVAGAVGFYWQLFPLTESSHALPVVLTEQ